MIQLKMKALEYSQHSPIVNIFFRRSRAVNFELYDPIKLNCELSEDFILSLLPARMKKIQSKLKSLECSQHYILIFQTLNGRLLQSLRFGLVGIQTHPGFYACLRYLVTCMLFIFLFIIDILFTYFLSDLDIDSKQVVYICFKILLEE